MSRMKIKSKKCKLKATDIPNMVDAVFDPDYEMPGWVLMFANAKGRDHVEGLFPQAHIAWREAGPQFPDDWRGFKINLPNVVSATETKLPLDITGSCNLDHATPAALAFLLAIGVKRQGGRAAIVDYTKGAPRLEVFTPREN
jgi:hypothetical protein